MQPRDEGKLLNKFNINYDDSSDEEEENESLTNYNINAKWKLYKKEKINSYHDDNIESMLSFVAHAAGIDLLYSKEINKQYYPAKSKYLSLNSGHNNGVEQVTSLIKSNIKLTLDLTYKSLCEFIKQTHQKVHSDKEIEDAYLDSISLINPLIDSLITKQMNLVINWIIDNRHKLYVTEPKELLEQLITIFERYNESFLKKINLKEGNTDRKKIKETLIEYAKNEVLAICKKFKFDALENAEGKKEAIILLSNYKGPFRNINITIIQFLKSCNARGYVENMIAKQFEDVDATYYLMNSYIDDLVAIQSEKKYKINKEYIDIIKQYFTYNKESISDLISTQIKLNLRNNLKNVIRDIVRPSLGKSFSFVSDNPYSFYANIRLSNRSQKRNIQNLKFMPFRNVSVSRSWRLAKSLTNDFDVLETQEITNLNLARKDMVLDVGNYEKVLSSINQLKLVLTEEKLSVIDKDIAVWLRSVFNGSVPTIVDRESINNNIITKLQAIAYLLFGCEPIRNPAMIVIHHMVLDLIIHSDGWTFDEVLRKTNRSMPMIPEGAVSVARGLETDLRRYMPYHYIYNGIEENSDAKDKFSKSDLIHSEANILKAWLKLNNYQAAKLKSMEEPEKIMNMIKKAELKWLSDKGDINVNKTNNGKVRK